MPAFVFFGSEEFIQTKPKSSEDNPLSELDDGRRTTLRSKSHRMHLFIQCVPLPLPLPHPVVTTTSPSSCRLLPALGFIVTSQNIHPPARRVATRGLVMNTPSESLLADFASEWDRAHDPVAAAPLAAPPPAAPLSPPSPPRLKAAWVETADAAAAAAEAEVARQQAAQRVAARVGPRRPLTPEAERRVEALDREWDEKRLVADALAEARSAEAHSREFALMEEQLRAVKRLADAARECHLRRRLQVAQTCEEEAQAKLRVHLTPRQSDGRISNSLGIDGWANTSLAELLRMAHENTLFEESFDPSREEDFVSWSKARPEVQARVRRIRARNSQRDEWVRHDPESARARRYVMLKEAAREVYWARGRALGAVGCCRAKHMEMQWSTHDLVEALADQAVRTHALEEALARQTAKIQLVKTLGRG